MKILISSIYHISSRNGGGNEQHSNQLALDLVKKGHEVTYLTSEARNKKKYPYKIIVLPIRHIMGKPFFSKQWKEKVSKLDFDIFHAFGSGIALWDLGFFVRKKMSKKAILTYPADSNPASFLFKIANKIEHNMIPFCFDSVICTTDFYREKMQKEFPKLKVDFVPIAIATHIKNLKINKNKAREILKLNKKKKLILFVGKLSSHQYYKGIKDLIDSAKYLDDNCQIIVVGDGNKRKDWQEYARNNNLGGKIKFQGFVSNEKISYYFKACNLFTLPSNSNSEGFGIVLVEAMRCKTPTLMTEIIGSAKWFKKERVSNFCKTNDSKDLAKKINNLIKESDKRKIERAYKFSLSFDSEKIVEKTIEIYKEKELEKFNKLYQILHRREPVWSLLRKKKKDGKLLDIGCGDGKFLSFAEEYYDCFGFDISKKQLEIAKQRCKKTKIKNFDIYKIDKYQEKDFDIITCFDVLEHVVSLNKILKIVRRKMKDDGIFLMSSVNIDSLGLRKKWSKWYGFNDKTHVNFLTSDEWNTILKKNGFIPVEVFYNGLTDTPYFKYVPSLLQKIVLKYFLQGLSFLGIKLPKKWGETLMIVCIKNPYLIYNPNFDKKLLD